MKTKTLIKKVKKQKLNQSNSQKISKKEAKRMFLALSTEMDEMDEM